MTKGVPTRLQPSVLEMLSKLKIVPSETPNDVVARLCRNELERKKK